VKRLVVVALLVLWASMSEAQRFTATHTSVSVAATSTLVRAANNSRNFLLLVNISDTSIFCKFGAPAVVSEGIPLFANGGSLLLDVKFSSAAVNCIAGVAGGKLVLVTEGVQ
jgi:hypothetical protein